MDTKRGKYKFGQRESDALFDLMQTLGLSNTDKPITYLATIKSAHKEILKLWDELEALQKLEADKHQYARFCQVCANSGEKPESFEEFIRERDAYRLTQQ